MATRKSPQRTGTKERGFEGRMFLHEYEWLTYLKRMPVRYIKTSKAQVKCYMCGGSNNIQWAHVIPFRIGVLVFGLTPDFLDGKGNIVPACKGKCNHSCEASIEDIVKMLKGCGVEHLPEYLPQEIKDSW